MEFRANDYKPGETFKFIRQCGDITQQELANKMHKSKNWVKANEKNISNFYFKDLVKMADLLGVDIIVKKK